MNLWGGIYLSGNVFDREWDICKDELEKRYDECKSGHKEADKVANYCNHCYRHLEYGTPHTDALAEKMNIPSISDDDKRALMWGIIGAKGSEEAESHKICDIFDGIMKVYHERTCRSITEDLEKIMKNDKK